MDEDGDCKNLLHMRLAQPDASLYYTTEIINTPELYLHETFVRTPQDTIRWDCLVFIIAPLVIREDLMWLNRQWSDD